jgi:hypothetical protein
MQNHDDGVTVGPAELDAAGIEYLGLAGGLIKSGNMGGPDPQKLKYGPTAPSDPALELQNR